MPTSHDESLAVDPIVDHLNGLMESHHADDLAKLLDEDQAEMEAASSSMEIPLEDILHPSAAPSADAGGTYTCIFMRPSFT